MTKYNLGFIEDEQFENEVDKVLLTAVSAREKAQKKFGRNVIDPFSALFEMGGFNMSLDDWKKSELHRQMQKTLQNDIGTFHQNILGYTNGWTNLGIGQQVDLMCKKKKIIAEIKNKYNTITGGKLSGLYEELDELISRKSSEYYNFTAYYVTIIPKTPIPHDLEFRPSDKAKGKKKEANPLIRYIDGKSFYTKVTNDANALEKIFSALPIAIERQSKKLFGSPGYAFGNTEIINQFFISAFGAELS